MMEVPFDRVVQVWSEVSDRQNTLGILKAFEPPLWTTRWLEGEIELKEIRKFRFIGGVSGDKYTDVTNGLYTLNSVSAEVKPNESFKWNDSWRIICLQDPESLTKVILDGNGRALALFLQMRQGIIMQDTKIEIIVGELTQGLVFRAKAVAPLWR
jgi:hypothetical protein